MTDNSKRQSRKRVFNRRTYLKAATGVAGAAALGISTAAADEGYDVIEVGPGETFKKSLSTGETWENKLIDITASGAGYAIRCHRNDTTIRNIGIRGSWDYEPSSSPFTVRAPDPDGKILIENVYLGDGADGHVDDGWSNPTGIYVHWRHAGDLEIRNVNIQEFPDNGIYGSDPGHIHAGSFTGQGGTVRVHDSYVRDCHMNFRLGSEGSYAENCIAVHTGNLPSHSCFRDYFGNGLRFEECDAYAPSDAAFNNGSNTHVRSGPYSCSRQGTRLVNCRAEASIDRHGPCNWDGSPNSNPRTDPSDVGAPTSAEAAASGESAQDNSSDNPVANEPETELPEDAHLVTFVTEPDAEYAEYELVVEGELVPTEAPYESPSGGQVASHRETVDEEDGVYSVASLSGGGHGDAYEVHGPVREVSVDQPDAMWIELDGEEVTEAELIDRTTDEPEPEPTEDAHLLSLVTEPDAEYAEYELVAEGKLIPTEAPYESPSGGQIAAHRETVDEEDGVYSVASLSGGGHGDAYEVHGPIREISIDQPDAMWIELDGEEMSSEEVIEKTGGANDPEEPENNESDLDDVAECTELSDGTRVCRITDWDQFMSMLR